MQVRTHAQKFFLQQERRDRGKGKGAGLLDPATSLIELSAGAGESPGSSGGYGPGPMEGDLTFDAFSGSPRLKPESGRGMKRSFGEMAHDLDGHQSEKRQRIDSAYMMPPPSWPPASMPMPAGAPSTMGFGYWPPMPSMPSMPPMYPPMYYSSPFAGMPMPPMPPAPQMAPPGPPPPPPSMPMMPPSMLSAPTAPMRQPAPAHAEPPPPPPPTEASAAMTAGVPPVPSGLPRRPSPHVPGTRHPWQLLQTHMLQAGGRGGEEPAPVKAEDPSTAPLTYSQRVSLAPEAFQLRAQQEQQ